MGTKEEEKLHKNVQKTQTNANKKRAIPRKQF